MKKYLYKNLFIFLICLTLFSFFNVKASLPLSGKIIIVDPVHPSLDKFNVNNEL